MKKLILIGLIALAPLAQAEPAKPYVENALMASSKCKSAVAFNMSDSVAVCERMVSAIMLYSEGRKSGAIDAPTRLDKMRLEQIRNNITFIQLQTNQQ